MFVKLARARGHTYAQIVESYRDANGQPRQRNLLTLGRVDENNGQVDKVLQTLRVGRDSCKKPQKRPYPYDSIGIIGASKFKGPIFRRKSSV